MKYALSSITIPAVLTSLLSAMSLLLVAHLIKGFDISGFGSALIAAVVIGLANGTIGFFLKVVKFALTVLTLGLFWWVINTLMLLLAAPPLYLASRSTVFFRPIPAAKRCSAARRGCGDTAKGAALAAQFRNLHHRGLLGRFWFQMPAVGGQSVTELDVANVLPVAVFVPQRVRESSRR